MRMLDQRIRHKQRNAAKKGVVPDWAERAATMTPEGGSSNYPLLFLDSARSAQPLNETVTAIAFSTPVTKSYWIFRVE